MKICQLCAVDFTLYHFLLPLMRALRERGHDVVGVCADGSLADRVRAEGFRVEPVAVERSFNLMDHRRSYAALRRLFERERFDLVHVHTPVAALVGRFAAWRARIPRIVYTAHGFYFHERMPAWKRAAFIALEWLPGRLTHTLFTQAEEDAATARRLRLCRGGKAEAIGNGVDPQRFLCLSPDERRRFRAELGATDDDAVIVMVGRLVAEKGYPALFAAMREVDATLWVVGERLDSDHDSAVDGAIAAVHADPALSARIRFLGYRSDVPQILSGGDIFTLPSHREGMPRSIIEAMFSALPVVATDIRGSREEVVPDETGYLVPVDDVAGLAAAFQRLAGDPELRASMGRAGRARALMLYDEDKVIDRQIAALGL